MNLSKISAQTPYTGNSIFAKIIYENTIFAKKFRACGAKFIYENVICAQNLENKGGVLIAGGNS